MEIMYQKSGTDKVTRKWAPLPLSWTFLRSSKPDFSGRVENW